RSSQRCQRRRPPCGRRPTLPAAPAALIRGIAMASKAKPSRPGSLGHQLLQVLTAVFRPGTSRHTAKQRGEAGVLIFGKATMRKYTAQAFELAEFIKAEFPDC